jgi:hypothetical protein
MKKLKYKVQTIKKHGLIAFILVLTLTSCEDFFQSTIELETPEAITKLVVTGFIEPKQDTVTLIVEPNSPLGRFERPMIQADVTMENITKGSMNTTSDQLFLNDYVLRDLGDSFINTDDEYLFTIHDQEGIIPSVTSQAKFPTKTVIKNIEFNYEGGIRIDGDNASSFNITFDDPAGEKNFYEIAILRGDGTLNNSRFEFTESTDISVSMGFEEDYVLISDGSFDGQEKTIELKVFRPSVNNSKYTLLWRDVTEDYFKYSTTLRSAYLNADNPFALPISVHSNIENGLGIISLYQQQWIPIN